MKPIKSIKWTARIQQSINGFAMQAAKLGSGKYLRGSKIPQYVREYFYADARGMITNEEAVEVLRGLARGRINFTTVHDIPPPRTAYAGRDARWGQVPTLDWKYADYVGDDTDGVYYGSVKTPKGKWWSLATVDSDTGGFVETLAAKGGYDSESDAIADARDAALDWCHTNRVKCGSSRGHSRHGRR